MIDNNDNHLSASTGSPRNPTQHNCSKVRDTFWTPPTRLSHLRPYHLDHEEEDDDDTSWTLPTILTYLKSLVRPARIPPREVLCLCLGDIWNILLSFLVNVSSPSHNFDRGGNSPLYVFAPCLCFSGFFSLPWMQNVGDSLLDLYFTALWFFYVHNYSEMQCSFMISGQIDLSISYSFSVVLFWASFTKLTNIFNMFTWLCISLDFPPGSPVSIGSPV